MIEKCHEERTEFMTRDEVQWRYPGLKVSETHEQMIERMLGESNAPKVKWLMTPGQVFAELSEDAKVAISCTPSYLRYHPSGGIPAPVAESNIFDVSEMD